MSTGRFVGRVAALAIALGVGLAAAIQPAVSSAEPSDPPSADSTALVVCGAACPTPDGYWIESMMNQFITPTHPGQTITPVAVTWPAEYWPVTGLLRLIAAVTGDPRLRGDLWPHESWWKLSGLFDRTENQSVQAGVGDLEAAMAAHGNDHLVIDGYSEGAGVVVLEKRKLAEQYPQGTTAPDISFVLGGDTNLPNGGLSARFPGLHIPILDILFTGPEPTNTQFHTDVITRQYDGAADFPLYPLNVVADLNAVMGFLYRHTRPFDVSLPADPTTSPAYQGTHGDSSYYFFPSQDLPLFDPLRQLGVPERLIDVVEPFFRVLVELGYDRSIPPWQPTPARLIPQFDPRKVITDLTNAVGEGINNAASLVGLPAPLNISARVIHEVPARDAAQAALSPQVTPMKWTPDSGEVSTDTATSGRRLAETNTKDDVSRETTTVSAPEPSASDAKPETLKSTGRLAKPRSMNFTRRGRAAA